MVKSNLEMITNGLDLLLKGLRPYVLRELKSRYGERWWKLGVEDALRGTVRAEARWAQMSDEERFELLDVQAILNLMTTCWNDVFQSQLGYIGRSYVGELREVRNTWAHQRPFSTDDAFRALDTMQRLLGMIGSPLQDELVKLSHELQRQRFEEAARREVKKSLATTQSGASSNLKAWRMVATPHPDVAAGRYQQAEFAADLFQVISGIAEPEYGDAKEFFGRTYLTEGLVRLLSRAWERLLGLGGDPVVQLQTNFGGGKTHSMIALYHLFGGQLKPSDVSGLEQLVPPALSAEQAVSLPVAHRAVLVGSRYSPAEVHHKPDGTAVHTLWGEMAWQLGESAGGKGAQAYALLADEDRAGVSPGSEKLLQLFKQYAPALILIDEWVVHARQIYGKEGLPAGSFDANMTFAQVLTEAAKAARNCLVVASIPASDIEIGGEGGRAALERIQNVFSRLESVWKPASATESFEIVRRRLFEPLSDYAARDAVCRAFAELYQQNRAEFPPECYEAAYEERMRSAYPIHPEFFDRLYKDWSTLEGFQLTRGVLRLMAALIHELWKRQDNALLILPAMVPLDAAAVRTEVTRHLPERWGGVIDSDIDGEGSIPAKLDLANPNLARFSACRRVARTIFIGSAPAVSAQRARGIEEVRIKLGCVQPGEPPAVFGDALRRLSEELTYLYSDGSRYWFDTHPTITRTAADRAAQYERQPERILEEIVRRMRSAVGRERGDFAAVHVVPSQNSDVPDDPEARLVILSPDLPHRARNGASKAQTAAQQILDWRGNSPRLYRNMLVFLAADSERLEELQEAVRYWMAWTSIQQDEDQLNLDTAQKRQVTSQIKRYEDTIAERLRETYCHLLVPFQEGTQQVQWNVLRLQGGEGLVERASRRLVREEGLITQWSPATLRIELDRWLWKDQPHLSLKRLWEYLASYLYLPRLRDVQVLLDAVRNGVSSLTWTDYFAYAARAREDGYYEGLVAGSLAQIFLDEHSVLVKAEVATQQLAKQRQEAEKQAVYQPSGQNEAAGQSLINTQTAGQAQGETAEQKGVLRRFHGAIELDPLRLGRDASKIADEVIAHLQGLVGSKVTVTLEIAVEVGDGIPPNVVNTVRENCMTLKFKSYDFDS